MFFILSKILNFLCKPIFWIVVCFVLTIVVRKEITKKRLSYLGIFLLLFFTNPFLTNEVISWWEVDPILFKDLKEYDLGIVLTGVTHDIPPKDRIHYQRGADRVLHTIQLYKLGKIKQILISGGSGLVNNKNHDIEALNLKRTMLLACIPDSVITIEDKSKNTHENALNTSKILNRKFRNKKAIIITSAFHMRRAAACFKKVGVNAKSFPVDFYGEERVYSPDLFIPSAEPLMIWQILFKEWFGMAVYKMIGYI